MENKNWVSVEEYAKKVGKGVNQVYLDIRTGKIPKEKVKEIKVEYVMLRPKKLILDE